MPVRTDRAAGDVVSAADANTISKAINDQAPLADPTSVSSTAPLSAAASQAAATREAKAALVEMPVAYSVAINATSRTQITSRTDIPVRVYGGTQGAAAPSWLRPDLGDYWLVATDRFTIDGETDLVQLSRDLLANLLSTSSSAGTAIPAEGELVAASDTGQIRVGDGVNKWANLAVPYSLVIHVPCRPGVESSGFISAAITAMNAYTYNGCVELGPGTHEINSQLAAIQAGNAIEARGGGATIRLRSTYGTSQGTTGGSPITLIGKGCTVRNIRFIGGSNTTSCLNNPDVGALISLGLGASFCTITDVNATAVRGWVIEGIGANVGGFYGLQINNITGNYNGGGLHIVGAATSSYGVQGMITNINLQVVMLKSVLEFEDCNDIQVSNVNACVAGNVYGAYGIHVLGISSSIFFVNMDIGSYPAVPGCEPIMQVDDTPNNIQVIGGVLQGGNNAVRINGGFNLKFSCVQLSRSGASGILVNGGDRITVDGCVFTRNGKYGSRAITDAALTSGSTSFGSPGQAVFTPADVYRVVSGTGLPAGTYIAAYVSATAVTLSAPATATVSASSATIGLAAEIQQTVTTPNLKVTNNSFQTPAGTGTEQVANVLRIPGSGNATLFLNNDVLGGHSKDSNVTGGLSTFVPGGPPKKAKENLNYNPYGYYTSAQKPVPASGSNTSGTHIDLEWYITANAAAATTVTIKNSGGPNADVGIVIPAGGTLQVKQPAGTALGFSYTSAPTAVCFGE